MDLIEGIKARKSIRGYKPDPVPKETIAEILEIATYAASAYNTQPWEFIVVGGEVLNNLKRAVEQQSISQAETNPDMERGATPTGVYRTRQVDLGKSIFQLLGIAREDKEKRNQWTLKMLRFFDAPNAIIISMDQEASSALSIFSIGSISQTIALAALHFGLGTCIEHATVYYPAVVRQILGIPESKKIVIGIAIGYPDWDFPANKVQTPREPVANIASWHGM